MQKLKGELPGHGALADTFITIVNTKETCP